jgi:hypothetical protein
MDVKIVTVPVSQIKDWDTFHTVFARAFGFPGYYGRNMNAWIDCMTYLDDAANCEVVVAEGGLVVIRIGSAAEFAARCPEQYQAIVECAAFVNHRRVKLGQLPILALMLIGHY